MTKMKLFIVAVVWATSLVGVGLWAQARPGQPIASDSVISGENIGFQRFANPSGGTISGRFVVRVDGQWLETTTPVRVVPLVGK